MGQFGQHGQHIESIGELIFSYYMQGRAKDDIHSDVTFCTKHYEL